ncbi:flagellar biosynthetic protein FliO [Photobacterium sp. TLY01]|uniref:flagellar biosynthetic protein FliO n=1 Tax=Photobacterium sp. TLY01 TaxID=2907534 RepID=UPI001F2A54D1|nr:flagellar biosynthetic protein FliO [Photobacterium sp. TLY01]UIP28720.1 flagellar biosynthetic protein FliO [Photobacterium sp. TLY01]
MKALKSTLLAGLALSSQPVWAAGAPELDMGATIGSLLLVLVLIVILAWLLRRMKLPGVSGGENGLQIVRQVVVGQRERIVLVQVGDEQLLIGVTPQNISMLTKLETPLPVSAGAGNGEFAQQLGKLLKRQ